MFIITSVLFIANSIGNIFSLLNQYVPYSGIIAELAILFAYLIFAYSIIHVIFFPLSDKNRNNKALNYKSFLLFTFFNIFFLLNLVFFSHHSKIENVFTKFTSQYLLLLSCFLLFSSCILFLALIEALKSGKITSLQIKVVFLYISIWGPLFDGVFLFMIYSLSMDMAQNVLPMILIMFILFSNNLIII